MTCAKMAAPIDCCLGCGRRMHKFSRVRQVAPMCLTTLFRELCKMAQPIDLPFGLWTRVGRGSTSSIVFARWRQCALMGGHIAANWRIRLNHLSAAAMRLMSNYLDHL